MGPITIWYSHEWRKFVLWQKFRAGKAGKGDFGFAISLLTNEVSWYNNISPFLPQVKSMPVATCYRWNVLKNAHITFERRVSHRSDASHNDHTAFQVYPGLKKRSIAKSKAIIFFSDFRKRWCWNLTAGEFWEKIIFVFCNGVIFTQPCIFRRFLADISETVGLR